ncbi:MAG: hypothetical protein ACRDSJ_23465 [Rubrobacteraceae bacterium]
MSGPFEKAYPNIAAWMDRGHIEIGHDGGFTNTFIRVLDMGNMVFEGETKYDSVDAALAEADAAIAKWCEENL